MTQNQANKVWKSKQGNLGPTRLYYPSNPPATQAEEKHSPICPRGDAGALQAH